MMVMTMMMMIMIVSYNLSEVEYAKFYASFVQQNLIRIKYVKL